MVEIFKGAIFDLDGTLIDSMGVWDKIDYQFLKKRDISLPDNLGIIIKNMGFRESALYFKKEFNLPDTTQKIIAEWQDMAFNEYAHHINLKPGVRKYISLLKSKGIKLGIASSAFIDLVEAVLNNNGIYKYFDAITTVAEVSRDKHFPDIYLRTAQKLNLKPEECIVFEDILPAVLSAKSAGMKVIGVYDKYSEYEKDNIIRYADHYIFDFYELVKD